MAKHPLQIYRALTRPLLAGGGEREPMGVAVISGLGLIALGIQFWAKDGYGGAIAVITGIAILAFIPKWLVQIAKKDPMAFQVYRRFIQYRTYYPARSTPHSKG